MKIIITESQFNFLFESNFEKNSRLIYKMWNDGMEFNEISDYTGLSLGQIIFLLKNKEIHIDCGFAEKLIKILFKDTDLITKKHSFDDMFADLEFSWGAYSGSILFEFNDKNYTLKGFATPYWNGDCKTPVEGSDFEDRESGDNYEDYDGLGLTTSYTPTSFDSISELIDFLNNEYSKLLIDPIKKLIHYYYNIYM
jgi:hypothetical protein